jgi:hypothetical protein
LLTDLGGTVVSFLVGKSDEAEGNHRRTLSFLIHVGPTEMLQANDITYAHCRSAFALVHEKTRSNDNLAPFIGGRMHGRRPRERREARSPGY